MKTSILILVLFIALFSNAQSPSIINITPEELCPGDSVDVSFSLSSPPTGSLNIKMYIKNNYTTIYTGPAANLTTNSYGYHVWYKFPLNYTPGQVGFCAPSTWCYFVWVYDCLATGIPTIAPNTIEPIYYDLHGNIIQKRSDELIIQRIGNTFTKIYIQP